MLTEPQVHDTPPPTIPGPERVDPAPGTTYQPGNAVWVWSAQSRSWCPGTVDRASPIALQVTYSPVGQRGTVADAVPPCYVARRGAGSPDGNTLRGSCG